MQVVFYSIICMFHLIVLLLWEWLYSACALKVCTKKKCPMYLCSRRRSDEHCPFDVKRQRFQSPLSQAAVATAASSPAAATHSVVHLQSEGRSCAPAFSAASSPQTPKPSGCVPPLRGSPYPELIDSPIPAAKDKVLSKVAFIYCIHVGANI